jgi:hypothetical protein
MLRYTREVRRTVGFLAAGVIVICAGSAVAQNCWDYRPGTGAGVGEVETTRALDVVVRGGYAYLADGSAGLTIVDVSAPSAPFFVASEDNGQATRSAWGVFLDGDYAYVAGVPDGYSIYDVSDPLDPTFVWNMNTHGTDLIYSFCVVKVGNYAYFANWGPDVDIIDVTDPESPSFVGTYTAPIGEDNGIIKMRAAGSLLYLAANGYGFQILDISSPTAPDAVGSLPMVEECYDVAVRGSYAYVAAANSGLVAVDVSTPSLPVRVAEVALGGEAVAVSVQGSFAYLLLASQGLRIVDITDPLAPVAIGNTFLHGGELHSVLCQSDFVYIANDTAGLQIDLRQCELVEPSFLEHYSVELAGTSVLVRWAAGAFGAPSVFRLVADDGTGERLVPFVQEVGGEYVARDSQGATGGAEEVAYRLYLRDDDGAWILLAQETVSRSSMRVSRLLPAWPNPCNPATTIAFELAEPARVDLGIYDLGGALVNRLVAESLPGGRHEVPWRGVDRSGRPVPSGVYLIHLATGNLRDVQKLMLLK